MVSVEAEPPANREERGHPMMGHLLDLELPLSIVLGRAVMPIRELLKITSGSLIELDRKFDSYVDLFVHGKLIARGEVISVKGNYGVRIKDIASKEERLALKDLCEVAHER